MHYIRYIKKNEVVLWKYVQIKREWHIQFVSLKNVFVYTYAYICRNNCEMIPTETGNSDSTWVGNLIVWNLALSIMFL